MQVFRTYNASVTLDALLHKESTTSTVDEKKAEYDRANKEVRQLTHPCLSVSFLLWHAKQAGRGAGVDGASHACKHNQSSVAVPHIIAPEPDAAAVSLRMDAFMI